MAVKILNVLCERVDPLDQFVGLVVGVKNLVDSGFIEVDAFLDDVNFVECLEMGRLDMFDEGWPFLIAFEAFEFFFVLVFGVFFELFSFILAHLECLFGEILADEGEVVVDFVESEISCPDELFDCQSLFYGGDLVGEEEKDDKLGLDGDGKVFDFIHVDSVLAVEVVGVVNVEESVDHLIQVSVLEVELEGWEDIEIGPDVEVKEGLELFPVDEALFLDRSGIT